MSIREKKTGWALIDTIAPQKRIQIHLGTDLTKRERSDWERVYEGVKVGLSMAQRIYYGDHPRELKELVSKMMMLEPDQLKTVITSDLTTKKSNDETVNSWQDLISEFSDWEEKSGAFCRKVLLAHKACYSSIQSFLDSIGCRFYHDTTSAIVGQYLTYRATHRANDTSRNANPVSISAIKKDLDAWRRLVDWAIGNPVKQLPDRKIFWGVSLPKATPETVKSVVPLTTQQITDILKSLVDYGNEKLHDLVLLSYLTGCEVKALDFICHHYPDCIDKKHHTIKVFAMQVSGLSGGKTDSRGREIPITPTIQKILDRGFIFEKHANTHTWLGNHLRKKRGYIYPTGYTWTMHQLRHSYASHALMSGVPVEVVSRRCGHSNISVTLNVYGKYASMGIATIKKETIKFLKKINEHYFDGMIE